MQLTITAADAGWDWWQLISALAGTVVGALVGAIPAFILAKRSAKEVLDRDAAARAEANKSAIFRVSTKLLLIIDTTSDLRTFLLDALSKKDDPGREHMEPWQLVPARTGDSEHDAPSFDPDELAVFFADGEYEFMQKLVLLERRARSIIATFKSYCTRREDMRDKAPTPSEYEGSLGKTWITPEERARLMIYTIPLNDLIEGMEAHLDEDWRLIKEVIDGFNVIARRHLKMPGFTIQFDDGAEATAAG